MKEYADLLLKSMVAHDPWTLPLADRYAATENSVAGSLNMMSPWRTVTGVKQVGQYIIDRPAGIVVAIAVIPGFVSPYVIPTATESCFVPAEMMHMHLRTLDPESFKGRQVLVEMPAVAVTTEIVRLHSGMIQGLQMFHNLQGPGGGTPWVTR